MGRPRRLRRAAEAGLRNQDSPETGALRAKLDVRRPALAMAAHSPLAAKLTAEAGFDAVWASGFELSASYTVPDASILPVGTHLEIVRAIRGGAGRLVEADTAGFGNAVNVAVLGSKHTKPFRIESAGAALTLDV